MKFANDGMQSGDMADMQNSLQDLLSAASAKFVTSIVGVGLSIVMKVAHSIFSSNIRHSLADLSNNLEQGLLYVSLQGEIFGIFCFVCEPYTTYSGVGVMQV